MFGLVSLLLAQSAVPAPSTDLRATYTKTEAMIPMRDGTKLYTAIYAPKDTSQKWPFLMVRTPYSSGPYGPDRFPARPGPSPEFSRRGYIFVSQDVRGRYMSEGKHIFSPPHKPNKTGTEFDESSDTYDTIEWLLKNVPNHNGKVGLWGISQPGFYATNALFSGHPAIAAISPQAPVTDRFRGDDDHHNGAFFLAQRFNFLNGFGAPRPIPTTRMDPTFRATIPDLYKFFLEMGPLPNAQRYFKNRNQFWNWVMAHGTYDDFWRSRGIEQHLTNRKGPAVLVVGGTFDAEDLYGAWKTYAGLAKNSPDLRTYLVEGPWWHGQWSSDAGERIGAIEFGSRSGEWYRDNIILPFFEHELRGGPDPKLPTATVFESGANQWRTFDQWPPKETKMTPAWPTPEGGLQLGTAPKRTGSLAYLSDPRRPVPFTAERTASVRAPFMLEDQRFAELRSDVLTFQTPPLTEDVTLAGPIVADLRVAISTTDADFVAKVIDVFPDDAPDNARVTPAVRMAGYEMLVRAEVMRGKFRNSLTHPEPFRPGKVTPVKIRLNDVLHTFKKGHRIMVQVQSSWFPLVDLNPQSFTDIYKAKPTDFQPSHVRLFLGPGTSHLMLPVLRTEETH